MLLVISLKAVKCLPLQKHLGQSLSGIQSPLGRVEYAWDAETLSLFVHAENGAYASAEIMMHNCFKLTATQFYTEHLWPTPVHRNTAKAQSCITTLYGWRQRQHYTLETVCIILFKVSSRMLYVHSPLRRPVLPDPSLSPTSAACKKVWKKVKENNKKMSRHDFTAQPLETLRCYLISLSSCWAMRLL